MTIPVFWKWPWSCSWLAAAVVVLSVPRRPGRIRADTRRVPRGDRGRPDHAAARASSGEAPARPPVTQRAPLTGHSRPSPRRSRRSRRSRLRLETAAGRYRRSRPGLRTLCRARTARARPGLRWFFVDCDVIVAGARCAGSPAAMLIAELASRPGARPAAFPQISSPGSAGR
jgi:hypothetical protein